jgi:competence protein ComEC
VRVAGKLGRALGKARAQIWYADVTVQQTSVALPVRIKRTMQNGLDSTLSPVAAGFASGLLFGGNAQLPSDLRQATQQTGLTHIVAVSGYNLTIIIALAMTFLRGRIRLKNLIPILALMASFVVMTGASSSVVRAAVMTSLVLTITTQRRRLSASAALAVTVLSMTMWDPRYLYQDLSWQLSVLALFGVIFLAPLFMPRTPKKHKLVWELFAVSLAAHLATAPLIVFTFESFSIIAPLANIIILPFIPLAMLASFLAAAVGVLVPVSFYWLAAPLNQFLLFILRTIQLLAGVPHASVDVHLGVAALVTSFTGLAFLALIGARRTSKKALQQV